MTHYPDVVPMHWSSHYQESISPAVDPAWEAARDRLIAALAGTRRIRRHPSGCGNQ